MSEVYHQISESVTVDNVTGDISGCAVYPPSGVNTLCLGGGWNWAPNTNDPIDPPRVYQDGPAGGAWQVMFIANQTGSMNVYATFVEV